MNINQTKKINLKLYLEGIEIPIQQIQIIEQAGMSAQSIIQVPLNDTALDIEPRTTVHVFYKDTFTNNNWLLIFEGEVAGTNIFKSTNSRAISLTCTSLINHWEYAIKSGSSLNNNGDSGFLTSRVNLTFSNLEENEKNIPNELRKAREIIKEVEKLNFDNKNFTIPSTANNNLEDKNEKENNDTLIEQTINLVNELPSAGGLNAIFQKAISDNANDLGLTTILKSIIDEFSKSNIGYTVPHIVYKITTRIKAFYNERLNVLLKGTLGSKFMEGQFDNISSQSSLIVTIMKILNLLNYKLISSSAPTYNEETGSPQSFVFLPTPTTFAPIACNIIFKDEVSDLQYSRNYLNEITRLAGNSYPTNETIYGKVDNYLQSLVPIVIAPTRYLTYNTNGIPELILTKEERMRGVYGNFIQNDFAFLIASIDKETLKTLENENEETVKKFTQEYSGRYLDSEYQNKKLSTRTFSITTTYSPYRLCGMPGIFIDDKLPNVMGLLYNITSIIDANGSSQSQISFRYPNLIKDNSFLETSQNIENENTLNYWLTLAGWSESDISDLNKKRQAYPYDDKFDEQKWIKYLKHRLLNKEDILFLNSWFDKDTFFPDVIGNKIYKTLMYGISAEAEELNNEDEDIYFKMSGEELDGSLGKYRDKELLENIKVKNSWTNTDLLVNFIYTLKKEYKLEEAHNSQLDFINKVTRRNIITEDKYWKFLIGEKNPEDPETERSIMVSFMDELNFIKENKNKTPFIKERREVINRFKNSLIVNGEYYIGT
jgi:hypothetical protein